MIPLSLFCIFLASLIISIPVGFMEFNWIRINETGKVAFHFLSHRIATTYMFWVGVLLATATTITVSLYVYMFCKVRNMNTEQRKALRTQVKLAVCAFFLAMCLAILSVCFCLFSFYTETITWGDNALSFFISCDLNTFCNVYLLLCTSEIVRTRVWMFTKRLFCCDTSEPLRKSSSVIRETKSKRSRSYSIMGEWTKLIDQQGIGF